MSHTSMPSLARIEKAAAIAEIDSGELALRLMEAIGPLRRPPGKTPRQLLDMMDGEDRQAWLRAAHAAMEYWRECIANSRTPS